MITNIIALDFLCLKFLQIKIYYNKIFLNINECNLTKNKINFKIYSIYWKKII